MKAPRSRLLSGPLILQQEVHYHHEEEDYHDDYDDYDDHDDHDDGDDHDDLISFGMNMIMNDFAKNYSPYQVK